MWRTVIPSLLAQASIQRQGDGYLVRFANDDGTSFEIVATFEQLDALAEDIDRQLDADEDEDAG